MDVNNLQAFIAVAEQGSFSLAAEHLHLTQPAISKRISTLELQLDVKLFDRIGRGPHLTEAGETLLPKARSILIQVEESRQLMRNLSGKISGRLRLGTSHHVGLHRLPDILRRFHSEFPDVSLDIEFTDSEIACQMVSRGELELAIVTLPDKEPEELTFTPVWEDPLCFVCGAKDRLAIHAAHCDLALLLGREALLPSANTFTRRIVDQVFANEATPIKLGMETNYLETLKTMVSIGLGWSALPRSMLDETLIELHVPGTGITRWLGVIQHRKRTPSNAAKAFLQRVLHPQD